MKKINIIQFLPYFPPHKGGLETHAKEWAEYWVKKGYGKIINITTNIGTEFEGKREVVKIEKRGIITYYLPSIEIIWNFPVYKFWNKEVRHFFKYLTQIAKQENYLIITRTRFFLTSLIGGFFAKKNKLKRIHIEHGSGYVKLSSKFKTFVAYIYDKIFGKWIFSKSDLIIPISNACNKFVLELGGKKIKLGSVIYRGFDFINLVQENKIDYEIDEVIKIKNWKKEGITILGFVGRIYKWKGVENIIQGLQKICSEDCQKIEKIKLVIVGDGEDLERLKKLAKDFGLANYIYFTGGKSFKEALAIQSQFDIHIHSSLPGGGLSGTLVQGMYLCPIIITSLNEGGGEIIGKNKGEAIIIGNKEDYSIDDMKKAILKGVEIFKNGKDFRVINKVFIEKTFDWNKNIEKYYLEFKKLFNGK